MEKKVPDLAKIDELAIDALSDEDLDIAAGGQDVAATTSCSCCAAGATIIAPAPVET